MYNEEFARAVLSERARERETVLHLKRLVGDEHGNAHREPLRASSTYLRGIPASVWRAALARRRQPNADETFGTLADAS